MTGVPKPGDVLVVSVRGIGSEGAGVGRLPDGRAVFVHRTAPGDLVEVVLTRVGGRWARARLVRVLVPGTGRGHASCPHYERCGGCTLQHLEPSVQLRLKGQQVREAMVRIGKLEAPPEPRLHASPRPFRYRNRVSLSLIRRGDGSVVAGFRALEDPDRVVDVDERCLLPEEPIARAWEAIRASWGPGARLLPRGRELRLTLRATSEGEVLLFIEGGHGDGDPTALLSQVPELRAIWRASGSARGSPCLVAGDPQLEELWLGEPLELRPRSFLQVNRLAAEQLHEAALRSLGPLAGRRLLDAYCGFGVYGRAAARAGAISIGIETEVEAWEGTRLRPQEGFRIIKGRVEDRIEEALPMDLVILNPPRRGVGAGVMETLARSGAERIVYVSCDPATLARDLALLGPGYRLSGVDVFDLFPQTARVETLVRLDRR